MNGELSRPIWGACEIFMNHLLCGLMATPPLPPGPRLTKKQAAFRDAILAGFGPSDAYRKAFDAKDMSKKAISVQAQKLLKMKKIALAISLATQSVMKTPAIMPPLGPRVHLSMERRLEELSHAATLDPIDAFDDLNHFRSIREMPEHVRRCIAGFEIDPIGFVLKVKFMDKRAAIDTYSKLAGDIPKEKAAPVQPRRAFDLSKLTDDELKEHMRLRKKAMVLEGPES